jgi:hypothetical protein
VTQSIKTLPEELQWLKSPLEDYSSVCFSLLLYYFSLASPSHTHTAIRGRGEEVKASEGAM